MVVVSSPTLLETADLTRPIPENNRKLSQLVQIEEKFVDVGVSSPGFGLINHLCPAGQKRHGRALADRLFMDQSAQTNLHGGRYPGKI